jgi:cob(I)alamin adenosyltransferase
MVIVFTGNGKGKTTAALGQSVRMLGRGKNVLIIQFIKGPWRSGEDYFAEAFNIPAEKFQIKKMGLGFVGILGDSLPKEKHMEAARNALVAAREELKKNERQLIILDEINVAVSLGLISEDEVLEILREVPIDRFVILTGRGAPQSFIDRADLVTEMKEIKHPFNDGKMAKIALEF